MLPQRQAHIEAFASRHPGTVYPLAGPLWTRRLFWSGFLICFFAASIHLGLSFERFWRGLGDLGVIMRQMWPPTHHGFWREYIGALGETLAMAFLGTLAASLISLPLGFLGARNVVKSWPIHFGLRRALDVVRGVDTLVWALIFVSVVGLGPFAGILAIALNDTGVLAKIYAEAIENIDRRSSEAVRAAGGTEADVARLAIFPQVFPVLIANSLYFFEANTRSATILGVVGAGGIGYFLADRIRVNAWSDVAFIILLILPTVAVIDILSRWLRGLAQGRQRNAVMR
ncbi:phosphonate ABC transporter, permease protein PhnE [Paenirhodobacter populi]|uniref:Phosphonate ABC transporter, permease protein PhnE n=1 Tax=Paenirhodobacter populi TaxID=2306993 RepID=A0A443J7S1_9RHOB|nr:phosphonate ABC transporter, permease protein PhnE [Sinirhodobacter populi]RWR16498.1 phosphonate ABC transporter, permease protein PhnE [Sinirhodobacter populi]